MPKTRSTRGEDTETPAAKLGKIESKLDHFLFFNYYDGLTTDGAIGFKVDEKTRVGSVKHRTGIFEIYSKSQFRSKARKYGVLVESFRKRKEEPPENLHPQFTVEEVQELVKTKNVSDRTPTEKLSDYKTIEESFIFLSTMTAGRVMVKLDLTQKLLREVLIIREPTQNF